MFVKGKVMGRLSHYGRLDKAVVNEKTDDYLSDYIRAGDIVDAMDQAEAAAYFEVEGLPVVHEEAPPDLSGLLRSFRGHTEL
jgi:hypothetical protein